jgi:hypothetical protein
MNNQHVDRIFSKSNFLDDYEIAKRFNNRPGFSLVSCQKVGLPVYRLNLRVSTQLKKNIPPIEEFVLKCINIGLTSEEEIGGFLGLEPVVILDVMATLRMEQNIDLIAPEGSRQQIWQLTQRGKKALSEAKKIVPEEKTVVVHFDRLLGELKWYGSWENRLLHPKTAKEDGYIEIPPSKTPSAGELSLDNLEKTIRASEPARKSDKKEERDFLAVRSIEQSKPSFLPAKVLVYKSNVAEDIQVAFLVDDRMSEDYETAFARSRNPKKLGIIQALRESDPIYNLEIDFGPTVVDRDAIRESEKLKSEFYVVEKEYREVKGKVDEITTTGSLVKQNTQEREDLLRKLNELETELETLRKERETKSVALLEMWDHRSLFEKAMEKSEQRLLVISPWITAEVVDANFLSKFEKILKKGVVAHIGYGISRYTKRDKFTEDIEAVKLLGNLSDRFRNFTLERLGNTHSKILVSDQSFAVVTSFNWLSFVGDRSKPFRDERGTIHYNSEFIDEIYTKTLSQFRKQ